MITREKVKAHLKRHKIKYIAASTFLIGLGVKVAIHRKRSICKLCAVAHEASLKQAGWIFRYE